MAWYVALAATLVVVAASSGQSDVSSGTGGLSFPTSRLWALPEPANVAMRNTLAGGDTSAVFAEYHANMAHAGLMAVDSRDKQIEQQRVADRVTEEDSAYKPNQLSGRLDGLLQDNVPEHTGDKVLDRLAALHELVERKRQQRHAQHGDLIPEGAEPSAFLQPSAQPVMGLSMPESAASKPPVSFTETATGFTPGRPGPSSDGLLDPAEAQDGTLNADFSRTPPASSFSASPMSSTSTASALGRGDAIVSNMDSVVQGLKKIHGLRGAGNSPPSNPQPLSQGMQWPPSLASAATQPSFPAASPGLSSAPHPAAQMDPSFAAAIGAAAPDLAGPGPMSFNMPSASAQPSFSAASAHAAYQMDPSFASAIGAAAPDLTQPSGMSFNAPSVGFGGSANPPSPPDTMTSPVQALMGGAANGFGPISMPQAQPSSVPMSMSPMSQSPNSARLFEAPQPTQPRSAPTSPQAAQVPDAPQVIAPAVVFQPLVPSLSAVNSQQHPVPSMPSVSVQPPPVLPLSSVSPSLPAPLGMGAPPMDQDFQRVNQTTFDDEKEIAKIQAKMAASNPQVQLWVPNLKPVAAPQAVRMPAMTVAAGQPAPVAQAAPLNFNVNVMTPAQPVPVARPVAQHAPPPKAPPSAQGPVATPPVGSAPIIPVFDVDGNRIDADNEAMLRELKGEVANFEQHVTAMEHQEASLLQTDDSGQ